MLRPRSNPSRACVASRLAAMKPGGLVATSGKLLKNDVVVEVNGKTVSEDQVASDIIRASPGDVTFLVRRAPGAANADLTKSRSKSFNPFKRKGSSKGKTLTAEEVPNGTPRPAKPEKPPPMDPPAAMPPQREAGPKNAKPCSSELRPSPE